MVKKVNKKPTRKSTKISTQKFEITAQPWFRFAALAVVALVIGGVLFISPSKNSSPEAEARKVTDAFASAFSRCDFEEAKQHYIVFQTNPEKAEEYERSCKEGKVALKYHKTIETPDSEITREDGAGFLYTLQVDGRTRQVMVHMIFIPEENKWQVFSLSDTLGPTSKV